MTPQARFRRIGWFALLTVCTLFYGLLHLQVWSVSSEVKRAERQIVALEQALDQFRLDVGRYPSNEEGLQALNAAPSNVPGWGGPYLKKAAPNDPWGHPFVYAQPGTHGELDLSSYGKDGREGGTGENADITNW